MSKAGHLSIYYFCYLQQQAEPASTGLRQFSKGERSSELTMELLTLPVNLFHKKVLLEAFTRGRRDDSVVKSSGFQRTRIPAPTCMFTTGRQFSGGGDFYS